MSHTISFRRPEHFYVLCKMVVPPEGNVRAQIHRLEDLGYKIVEVSPPLGVCAPPQDPLPQTPQRLVVCEAGSSL